jgi:hypothetical protein
VFAPSSESHCRFCGASLAPEEVYAVSVPFFERSYDVCKGCRDAWQTGCRALVPFEPHFRGDRVYRWPRPLPEDAGILLEEIATRGREERASDALLALEAGDARRALSLVEGRVESDEVALAIALAAGARTGEEVGELERLSRLADRAKNERIPLLLGVYAHAVSGNTLVGEKLEAPKTASARTHLEAARSAYLLHLSYALKTELDGRVAALHALVTLELGDQEAAASKLRQYRRQADTAAAARDPRIPLLQALVQLLEGNFAATDDTLRVAIGWAKVDPKWAEVEALSWFDTYVRAVAGERWEPARDALKAFCKLRPDDRRALYDLGHTFMKCALDPVAREVLASYHARDPKDGEGALLYAACLLRLGETQAAWTLLKDSLDLEEPTQVAAERRHLAGLAAHAEGHEERAIELLQASFELEPEDHARENLVTLVLLEAGRIVEELEPEGLETLFELFSRHKDAFQREYGNVALAILRAFLAREVREEFKTAPSFGIDLFEKLHFGDADVTTLQAYELLAQRKLGDAVRRDRQAQLAGGRPIPIELLLRFLDRVRPWPREARAPLL